MAHIPSIKRSLAPLPNFKKRGQVQFTQTEEISETSQRATFTERRFRKDRRNKNIKMMFDRRKMNDRRNKKTVNQQNLNTDRSDTAGQMIDTTA